MKKRVAVMSFLVICLTFVSYVYLNKDDKKSEEKEDIYLKTVVFKDEDNELIPVSINFHSQVELEQEVRNRINLMKSDELKRYGLYPVLSKDLEVLSVGLENKVLTLNLNDQIVANKDDMSILEALTFTMTDYDNIDRLKIQINGKDISHLPNSTIPVSSLTKNLGLNNFVETSSILHETIPVMVYNEKVIHQYSYYIPTTIRIDENDSVNEQVKTILSQIQGKIQVVDTSLKNGVLTVKLGSNILLDNEKIDQTLEDLIVLSLSSLKGVKDVKIKINNEDVRTKKTSIIEYNFIKI
ncbi:MAG: GerMN domain-containing protein [Coprobacillus sp.]|nr:GerMN domain-containing protein [Coprobacillus sp.]MCI9093440.1 GerMN domain-containing protein [Coprobacillus sp.]